MRSNKQLMLSLPVYRDNVKFIALFLRFYDFLLFFQYTFFKLGWFVFVYLVSFRENIFGIHTTLVMVHKSNDCCRCRVLVAFLWLFCQSFVMRFYFCSVKLGGRYGI